MHTSRRYLPLRVPLAQTFTLKSFGARRAFSTDVELIKKEDKNESDTSASSTGVIDVDNSEVVLYFDHVYPLYVSKYSFKNYLGWMFTFQSYYDNATIKERALTLANTDELPLSPDAKIIEFIPVKRDGGAFLKFTVPPDSTPKELISQICTNISNNRENEPWLWKVQNFFYDSYPRAYQVKGTPWIEDLKRYPSPILKIKFEGDALTEEEIYLLFRRYGVIVDIVPQLPLQPLFATVIYRHIRSAIVAKNCLTGLKVSNGKTELHLQYEPLKSFNYITDFIVNHQKVSIPAILALLATFAVLIFDPIREWFIEQKITHKYSIETYKDNKYVHVVYLSYRNLVRWVGNGYDFLDEKVNSNCEKMSEIINETGERMSLTSARGRSKRDGETDDDLDEFDGPNILWMERMEKVKQLKLWIYENVGTFIIVKGPKGAGKLEFVLDHTLLQDEKLKRKILYIDCDALVKTRSDNSMLTATAHQLGYFPLFTWTNTILQFIDLGVQSVTGQKSGLSETKETQLKNMFLLTIQALRKAALDEYPYYRKAILRKQRQKARKEAREQPEDSSSIIPGEESGFHEDELLKEEQYLQQHPENKPIIIINKFLRKSDSQQDFIYKMIADWTSQVVQQNLAHVVYITHDVGSIQLLSDALPNQVFKTISLSDASVKSSKQFVLNQLAGTKYDRSSNGIDQCLQPIGGRMLDLQAFIRRVKSGETPNEAFQEMVNQAAEQITAFFLSNSANISSEDTDHNWLPAQVWCLMKILASNEEILYTDLCAKYPLFKTSPATLSTLSTLEKHDLISLVREKGVLNTVSTGRPLYREAFKNLIEDDQIFKIFESEYYGDLIAIENTKIAKFEEEISKISRLSDLNMLKSRLDYVQEKIIQSTDKIRTYEGRVKEIVAPSKPKPTGILSKIGLV